MYLLQGRLGPSYDAPDFGISEKLTNRVIVQFSGKRPDEVELAVPQAGRPRVGGGAAACWWYEASASSRDDPEGSYHNDPEGSYHKVSSHHPASLRRAHGAGAGVRRRQRGEKDRLARRAPAARVAPRGQVSAAHPGRADEAWRRRRDRPRRSRQSPKSSTRTHRARVQPLLGSRAGRPDAVRRRRTGSQALPRAGGAADQDAIRRAGEELRRARAPAGHVRRRAEVRRVPMPDPQGWEARPDLLAQPGRHHPDAAGRRPRDDRADRRGARHLRRRGARVRPGDRRVSAVPGDGPAQARLRHRQDAGDAAAQAQRFRSAGTTTATI